MKIAIIPFKSFFIALVVTFYSFSLFADIQVIQVKRNIPLSDGDPIYKDYYLSGGTKEGLKVNLVVPVMRWVNLRENNQAQDQSMKLLEPVGWLRVIYTQERLAVARLHNLTEKESLPVMEQPGILVGDIVTTEKSYVYRPSKKENTKLAKRKVEATSGALPSSSEESITSAANSVNTANTTNEMAGAGPVSSAASSSDPASPASTTTTPPESPSVSSVAPESSNSPIIIPLEPSVPPVPSPSPNEGTTATMALPEGSRTPATPSNSI